MAIGSAIIGKIKGHAGNLVFRVRKGEQVIQTKPGPRGKDHLPTYNQAWNYMRFKWASFMSQVTLELTDHSFTRRYLKQSSTNKFIQTNIQNFNPINKKTVDRFDYSTNAPLFMNGIVISTGDMAPVEFYGREAGGNADWVIRGDYAEQDEIIQVKFFNAGSTTIPENATWDDILTNETIMTTAKNWALSKGLKEGEMLTVVFMTALGYDENSVLFGDRKMSYGLEMIYIRFKLNANNGEFIVEPSTALTAMTEQLSKNENGNNLQIHIGERYVVGACCIHSKEEYGGWRCSDTVMKMYDPTTHNPIENYTWTQDASLLYRLNWSTQQMPILDPASLTEEDQQTLRTGKVIQTVNASGNKIYVQGTTEEVTVSGEDLEVSEKKKKKRTSETQTEE